MHEDLAVNILQCPLSSQTSPRRTPCSLDEEVLVEKSPNLKPSRKKQVGKINKESESSNGARDCKDQSTKKQRIECAENMPVKSKEHSEAEILVTGRRKIRAPAHHSLYIKF